MAVAAGLTTRRCHDAARCAAAARPAWFAAGFSRVHWVRPELVAEVKFLTWTEDNLLRQVVYEGLREDKPATEVRREIHTRNLPNPSARRPEQSGPGRLTSNACPELAGLIFRLAAHPHAQVEPGAVRPRFNLSAGAIACSRRQRRSLHPSGDALLPCLC